MSVQTVHVDPDVQHIVRVGVHLPVVTVVHLVLVVVDVVLDVLRHVHLLHVNLDVHLLVLVIVYLVLVLPVVILDV